ncbi:hypothetical protein [Hymenobacter sp. CRA2]|uniref:hypothetical protein n=1 Tax=Hymenobacter sp. CRA2 TaxID=1955620 RepID=UPI00098EB2D8|nr:hypothetical protein [Hymenobacter sp. CRA2]OON69057.1 hypothetical protein B0919_10120 [Hymenobacter sp. CRA2]
MANVTSASSPALDHFRQEFFDPIDQYLAWHDGYDANTAALDALTPAEQAVAEQELIAGLQARTADSRAIIGLGHLRSRAALPVLHEFLASAGAYALPAIARIDAKALDATRLNALLRSKLSEFTLLDVLVGLRLGFTLAQLPATIPATVLALIAHKDYLVRYHALATLRHLYQLPGPAADSTDLGQADHLFELICSDKKSRHYWEAQELIRAQIREQGYAV